MYQTKERYLNNETNSFLGTLSVRDYVFCARKKINPPDDPVKESVPQDAMKDLIRCMHFSDNWDDDTTVPDLDTKGVLKDGTTQHQKKYAVLEDSYNARW